MWVDKHCLLLLKDLLMMTRTLFFDRITIHIQQQALNTRQLADDQNITHTRIQITSSD